MAVAPEPIAPSRPRPMRAPAAARGGRETRLLGLLAMTLAALAAWQALAVFDDAPVTIAQPVRLAPATAGGADSAPLDTAEITERPLFVPTRRRAMPIAVAVAAPPPPPPPVQLSSRFQLVGLVVTDGRTAALLRSGASGPTLRVRQGEPLEDWVLEGTSPGNGPSRGAVFARGEERETLRLPRFAGPATVAAAAAPPSEMDDEEDEEEEAYRRGRGR